ncbi:peptidylprolyl isomerase [Mycobacterium asiaticum]|uniref:Peptidylprolyl isomerase n=1 Tax=Mycobacterium asiaticum TaxID=1790 RepID=A0A1A3N693_MYCAS|nr:peptidylprolyl isomerase [Mycobacterium asiaticum]OBK17678.1 peptidylprolyl isomerase [Mycobacterium asiaticum]
MPTNQQRRATAKRKLERQLERRAKQAKRRRILTIALGAVAAVAVVAAVVVAVVVGKGDHKNNPSASTTPSSSAPASPTAASLPPVQLGDAAPLPPFKAPANLGANCQYPASPGAKAGKDVKPPRTGKIPATSTPVSVSMVTSQGNIGLLLNNGQAPCTVNSFASLAGQDYFKDTKCHRLVATSGLSVLQCGDPKGDGTGGPGYQFADEYPTDQYPPNDPKLKQPVIYPRGTIAMANSGPNTNSSQFFLVYRDSVLPPAYTVFGKIQDDGLATLDKIAAAGVAGGGEEGPPALDVVITSVRVD